MKAKPLISRQSWVFLGCEKHFLALREIEAKVQKERPDDSHFLMLLGEEAQKLEQFINVCAKKA